MLPLCILSTAEYQSLIAKVMQSLPSLNVMLHSVYALPASGMSNGCLRTDWQDEAAVMKDMKVPQRLACVRHDKLGVCM